jgi:uncharacterized membrane protein
MAGSIAASQYGFTDVRQARAARALGGFGLALGALQLAAPHAFARWIGAPGAATAVRAVGLRELASGLGILRAQRPLPWLGARGAGDLLDLVLLALAARSAGARPTRLALAAAAVLGVAALDTAATARAGLHPRARPRQPLAAGRVPVEAHQTIRRPPADCYDAWRHPARLPAFMGHVERIDEIDERRWHWVAKGPAGTRVSWDAEIVADAPGRGLAWRSLPGSTVSHAGAIRFDEAAGGRGTVVRLRMAVHPPAGELGARLAVLFGASPWQAAREDLRRFKRLLETGEIPTTEGQPHGARSLLGTAAAAVNPS